MTGRWIKTLFTAPGITNEEDARRASILHLVTSRGIPLLFLFIAVRVLSGESLISRTHLYTGSMILSFFLSRFALQKGYFKLTLRMLIFIAWAGLAYLAWDAQGLEEGIVVGFLTITLTAGLLLGTAEAFFFLLLSILTIWGIAYGEVSHFGEIGDGRTVYAFARNLTINYTVAWVVLYFIISILRKSLVAGDMEIRRRQRTEATLQQQAAYLSALHEITLGIVNRLELRPLLSSILARACALVGTEHALVELVVPDGSALRLELGRGIPAPHEGYLTHKHHGLTGSVWASGETKIVKDYSQWEYRDRNFAGQFGATIGLPLKSGEDVIGVLALLYEEKGREFLPEQVSMLEKMAPLASLAIQNARLYENLQTELSERKQMEISLRDSEQKFRTIFETSPIAICITALGDGRLIEANYAYWDLTGYDPDTSLGKTSDELKLWGSPEARNEFIHKLQQKESLYNPDDEFLHKNGKKLQVISFYRLVNISGEICIISMFYDMSAQKQTMEALQQSETRVRALLEAIPDMIIELLNNGVVVNVIPPKGMEDPMPARQFIGMHIGEMLSESVAEQTLFAIQRSVETNRISMFEFEEIMGKSNRAMEARIVPNSESTVIMMIRDITQRKWVELEREKLIAELEEKNKESETLRESLSSIVGTFEFSEIIQRVLDQIQMVIPYDSASVWRVDGNIQKFITGRNLPAEFDAANVEFITNETNSALPIITGQAPYILSGNVQVELPDFQEPPHTYINSWLAVPLKSRGKIIGLIGLDGIQKDQFNVHHAGLAVTFANQVAVALENASLFTNLESELEQRRRLIEELQVMNAEAETMRESLASIVGTFEFSEIIQRILDQIQLVVPYDSASIWRLDGIRQILIGQRGLPGNVPENLEVEVNEQNHAIQLLKDEKPYIIEHDVQANPAFFQFHEPPHDYINSWLGVPLKSRGQIVGLIALDGRRKNQFSKRHTDLAVTFANQVAIALENSDLFSNLQMELEKSRALIAELELKNIESETLRESAAIVAATLDQEETIVRILDQLERVFPYDSASVQLVKGNMLEIVCAKGGAISDDPEQNKFMVGEDEPASPVLQGEVPFVLFDDIQLDFPAFREPPHDRIHAWMAVPLKVKGQILGIIALDGYQVGQFTERQARLAVTYANQVAIALENARLYSDLQADLTIRQNLISELESKNAELERFTYTVSHDLKSPLFTIRGFLGYLEQDAFSGNRERMKSDMQRITDATEKMHQLLNDLLELSRIGRLMNDPTVIPFDELVRDAVELVQGRIMECGVTVHIDADMPFVYGDRPRLLEVVQNLVDNAAKFMGDQPKPRIEIGWDGEEDGKPILYVRDNGMGIPSEHHERIFGLFNKLDVRVDGTGIGLALVKRIVEVHGGRIWVRSEAGKGSTFYFTLPAPPETKSAGA